MPNNTGDGFVDYVLWGKNLLPLAVIEAKHTSKDQNVCKEQAKLYSDCLEKKYGRRPMMFTYVNIFSSINWQKNSLDYSEHKKSTYHF